MATVVTCPECGAKGTVRSVKPGKRVQCPSCGARVRVPGAVKPLVGQGSRNLPTATPVELPTATPAEPPGTAETKASPAKAARAKRAAEDLEAWEDPSAPRGPGAARIPEVKGSRLGDWAHGRVLPLVVLVAGLAVLIASVETWASRRMRVNELRAGAERGDPQALLELGRHYEHKLFSDLDQAVSYYTRAARRGNPEALYTLGEMHRLGYGMAQDEGQALESYRRAATYGHPGALQRYAAYAEDGNVEAQLSLARLYDDGTKQVPRDPAAAARWYRAAAQNDVVEAQFRLGVMLAAGTGVEQDAGAALGWFGRAADQGHAGAQFRLGECYEQSLGTTPDGAAARRWYATAGRQGHREAQFRAGRMFYGAEGGPRDLAAALEMFTAATTTEYAADRPHAMALFYLAGMHYNGEGTPRDFGAALKAFRRAGEAGVALAQHAVALMMFNHQGGVPKDRLDPFWRETDAPSYWLSLAAATGGWPEAPVLIDIGNEDLYTFTPDHGLVPTNPAQRGEYPPPA